MNPQFNISRKKLTIICILMVVAITAIFLAKYFLSFKSVLLSPTDGTTIVVTQGQKEFTSTQVAKTARLYKGQYTFRFTKGTDYQDVSIDKYIDSNQEITSPQLSYTATFLDNLLTNERAAIQLALSSVSGIANYQIAGEELYVRGEWYCARLLPNSWYDPSVPADYLPRPVNLNNALDIVKVIAKKDGGQWQIVTGPAIVFNIDDNPNIPEEVVRLANALGLSQ